MDDKLRAAHALNLCTVSISQIVAYNDINVLKQEYDNIINNLNLENIPKDEALLTAIKQIMTQITILLIDAGDKDLLKSDYDYQLKNAIWSAVPTLGGIFASGDALAIGLSLATQIGVGFMNYRRNLAEIKRKYIQSEWELSKNKLMHLNALKESLFETAWHLAEKYNFPDEYRLNDKKITEYNNALMEPNDTSRYLKLQKIEKDFQAYPPFWYQFGSTANKLFQSDDSSAIESAKSVGINTEDFLEIKMMYRAKAIECFEKYKKLNTYHLLNNDFVTASWAMEYLELLNINSDIDPQKATELLKIAENNSGNAPDILEICAFDYLRINDYDNASRLFLHLVNENYNSEINTQVLSCLYIRTMRDNDIQKAKEARIWYNQLKDITNPEYIIPIPDNNVDLSELNLSWIGQEAYYKRYAYEQIKQKARTFYQKQITIVYRRPYLSNIASRIKEVIDAYKNAIDPTLPNPIAIEYKDYKKSQDNASKLNQYIDNTQTHTLFINGYPSEAKKFYADKKWDYNRLGIKIKSQNTETLLFTKEIIKSADKEEFERIEYNYKSYYSDLVLKKDWERMYLLGFFMYLSLNNAIVAEPNESDSNARSKENDEICINDLNSSSQKAQEEAKKVMTEDQLNKCHLTIHTASVACGACGVLPFPVADTIPITATQIAMVISLGKIFDMSIEETAAKSILSAVSSSTIGRTAFGAIIRFVPGIGWAVSAGIAAGITESIGWIIASDFAKKYNKAHNV